MAILFCQMQECAEHPIFKGIDEKQPILTVVINIFASFINKIAILEP